LLRDIQVSIDTSVPNGGEYPGFGPRMLRFESPVGAVSDIRRVRKRVKKSPVRA
jgi:hypothetical protein